MSPLAKLSFKLRVVGDTRLKTGWVRCRNGAGEAGRGGAGDTVVQFLLLAPGSAYVCVRLEVPNSPRGLFGCNYFSEVHSRNAFYANIIFFLEIMAYGVGAFLRLVLVRLSNVSKCSNSNSGNFFGT